MSREEIENFFEEIKNNEEIEVIEDIEDTKLKDKSWKKEFDKLDLELMKKHDSVFKIIDAIHELISYYVDDLESERFEVHKKMKDLFDTLPEEEKEELKKEIKYKIVNNDNNEGYYIPDRNHAKKFVEFVAKENI